MRAAVYERYGAPEVVRIQERGEPGLGAGEVLVRVEATVVGAAESAARSGSPWFARLYFGLRKPRFPVLGTDFGGTVERVGEGVTRFAPGDLVFGSAGTAFGAHAEFVTVAERHVIAHVPERLDAAGGGRDDRRIPHRAAVPPRRGARAGRPDGARERGIRNRRHRGRAAREAPRRVGRRRVQRGPRAARGVARRRSRHRLCERGLRCGAGRVRRRLRRGRHAHVRAVPGGADRARHLPHDGPDRSRSCCRRCSPSCSAVAGARRSRSPACAPRRTRPVSSRSSSSSSSRARWCR